MISDGERVFAFSRDLVINIYWMAKNIFNFVNGSKVIMNDQSRYPRWCSLSPKFVKELSKVFSQLNAAHHIVAHIHYHSISRRFGYRISIVQIDPEIKAFTVKCTNFLLYCRTLNGHLKIFHGYSRRQIHVRSQTMIGLNERVKFSFIDMGHATRINIDVDFNTIYFENRRPHTKVAVYPQEP